MKTKNKNKIPTSLSEINTNDLKKYREQKGLKQVDIQKILGVNQSSDYHRWETGKIIPTLITALKLSVILNCPVQVLFFDHFQYIREEIKQRKNKLNINKENYV